MKKIIFSIILILPLGVIAQSHIVFMGIPLNDNYHNIAKKIQQKGFKIGSNSYENGKLETFYNYPEYEFCLHGIYNGSPVNINLSYTPLTEIVRMASISYYELSDDWKATKSKYEKLKSEYISKYGQPDLELTNENEPYSLMQLRGGHDIDYSCGFYVKGGRIFVCLNNYKDKVYVLIIYVDDINQSRYERELSRLYR